MNFANKTKQSQFFSSREPPWLSVWVIDDGFCVRSLLYWIGSRSVVFSVLCWHRLALLWERYTWLWVISWLSGETFTSQHPLRSALSGDPTDDWALMGRGRSGMWGLVTFYLSGGDLVEFWLGEHVCRVSKLRWAYPYQECWEGDSSSR